MNNGINSGYNTGIIDWRAKIFVIIRMHSTSPMMKCHCHLPRSANAAHNISSYLGMYSIVIDLPALRAPFCSCWPLNDEKALTSDKPVATAAATRITADFMVEKWIVLLQYCDDRSGRRLWRMWFSAGKNLCWRGGGKMSDYGGYFFRIERDVINISGAL